MRLWLLCSLVFFLGGGCRQVSPEQGVTRLALPAGTVETAPKPRKAVRGQTLYVPCYSHVYLLGGQPYNLAITLSLRNTSISEKLIVSSIAYYDSTGKLVKELADQEIELAPMAVAEALVHEEDKSGGSGASFVVRWVAESEISDPVVEAAMVGSGGSLGVSFLTQSRVLDELSSPATPSP